MGSLRVGHDWKTVTHHSRVWSSRTGGIWEISQFKCGSRFRVCAHIWAFWGSPKEKARWSLLLWSSEYLFTLNTFLRVRVSCFPTQVALNAPRGHWQHHSWKHRKLWPWQWDACLDLGRWRIAGAAGGGLCVSGNAALSLREEVPVVGKPGMDASAASPCPLREGSPVPRQDDWIWSLWAVLIPLLQAYLFSLIF